MNIPIELFLGFIATTVIMIIIGIARSPQIPALVVFAGLFILTLVVTTDGIIMGKIPVSSTGSGSTTTYTFVDNVFVFDEFIKVIFALFAVILMLSGALLTKMGDSFG